MGFMDDVKKIRKSEADLRRDLIEIVRTLPGLQRILDEKKIDVNQFEIESDGRRFSCRFGNDTLTILVEDLQYRVVYIMSEGVKRQEQRFDKKTKIETLRILEFGPTTSWIHRDPDMLEKVKVLARMQGSDLPACYYDISEKNSKADKLDDIATLDACGDFIVQQTDSNRYRDCVNFTERKPERVAKAVQDSNYTKQCLEYDKNLESMLGRTQ